MRRSQAIVDDRNYTLHTAVGERRCNLTHSEAIALANKRHAEWQECGRDVAIHVTYRDGSAVEWQGITSHEKGF